MLMQLSPPTMAHSILLMQLSPTTLDHDQFSCNFQLVPTKFCNAHLMQHYNYHQIRWILTEDWLRINISLLLGVYAKNCSTYWPFTLTLSQWSSSGNPVAIQCAWNLDPSVHWNATGEMPVCFQWSSSGLPVAFQWSSSVFQLCKLTLDCHWDTTGYEHQPVWFQWHPSVLVAPVVFQCVPIMQINTGSPLEHHWVLASASVVPVASQCTCGYMGLPVRSVQWYPSVLTESGLEVIGSGHFPACDP